MKGPPGFDSGKTPFSKPMCLSLPVHCSLHLLPLVLLLGVGAPIPWPMPPPHSQDTHHPGVSNPLFSVWPQPVRGLVLKAIFSPLSFLCTLSPIFGFLLLVQCLQSVRSSVPIPCLLSEPSLLHTSSVFCSVCPLVPSLRFSAPRASSLRPCPCHPAPRPAGVEAGKLRPGQHRPRPRPRPAAHLRRAPRTRRWPPPRP